MAAKTKKWFWFAGILALMVFPLFVSGQHLKIDTNKLQLANRYYQGKEYEKASVLFKELYETSGTQYYFEVYLNCLIETQNYSTAEKEIKQELRHTGKDASLYVLWSYLLKKQNRYDEGNAMLEKAIEQVEPNKIDYTRLANMMIGKGEFDFAEKLYQDARQKFPGESFHYELGRVYMYERNYEKMFDEYLQLIREDETAIGRMQSVVQSAFRMDVDNSLRGQLRTMLLRQMQKEPDVMAYNRVLIWLFLQEQNFSGALRQQIALDKRTGQEDAPIMNLAQIAGHNKVYAEALKSYDYILAKGEQNPYYPAAMLERMQLQYARFTETSKEQQQPQELNLQFEKTFEQIGYSPESYKLIQNYAHFLAFWMAETDKAVDLLNNAMVLPGLNRVQRDELKTELADINVYNGDVWEAVLLYSQVIESNKMNDLGDEVKLKKARLSYFIGDLQWAKAQLDVIKASTSKLVANDAMELSLFIGNNSDLDTTSVPVQLFARADFYSFKNEKEKAWAVLDSIELAYPYNSLIDDIYFRKANLLVADAKFDQAAEYYTRIMNEYPTGLLGDDAMYRLAELYSNHLNQKEKAQELFKEMLVKYPGSVYVSEARRRYRELRGDFGKDEGTNFFNGEDIN